MGNFDHDSYPDNNWEDSWNSSWSEFAWERYLQNEESEVKKYQKLYSKLQRSQNRLDEVALYMGWESKGDSNDEPLASTEGLELDPQEEQPYTLHKHPLFIANKALHGWLQEKWMQHASLCSEQLSSTLALKLQNALNQSDYYGTLAVNALDMGDYMLSVAYFKRGLSAINEALSLLSSVEQAEIEPLPRYCAQARIRLFDLREIWLRIIADCRDVVAKRSDED